MAARVCLGSIKRSRCFHRSLSGMAQILVKPSIMAAHCKAGRNRAREVKPNSKKMIIASNIKDVFANNDLVAVFQYGDLSTKEWDDLRHNLGKDEIKVKVFPNRLTHKAIEDSKYQEISPLFLCTTCVIYSQEPKVKSLIDVVKKQSKLELLGAKVENRLLSRASTQEFSKLPSLKELHVHLSQLLQKPASQLNSILQQNQRQLSEKLSQFVHQEQEKL